MPAAPIHRCRVLGSPWPGVYATDIESSRHYGKHWHATYGFGLIDDGAHRSSSGRGSVEAFAGDLVATNPGEVHDGRPLGGPSRRWRTVYLEPEVLALVQAETGGKGEVAFDQAAFRDPRLRQALVQLLHQLERWTAGMPNLASTLACEEALVQACGLMLAGHSTAAERAADEAHRLPGAVLERLDNLSEPASLAELARIAGVGKFQLLRRFRRAYGCTPHAWLLQQRAERARGLVAQGLSLANAAAATGFADQSHLTRVFVQRFGFTPGAWQRISAPRNHASRPQ